MTRWIRALRQGLTLAIATAFLALGCGKADGAAADGVSTSGGGGGLAGQGGSGGLGGQSDTASGGRRDEPRPGSGVPRADATGLGWSLRDDTPHDRRGASAVVDTAGDRLIVFGDGGNDIWSLALSGEHALQWSQLIADGDQPLIPFQSGVYDPVGNRLLLLVDTPESPEVSYGNPQIFELTLEGTPRFQRLAADGPQPGRQLSRAKLALDSAGKRLFALGGTDANCGLWALSLDDHPQWSRVANALNGGDSNRSCLFYPTGGVALVFDAPRQRLVAFGDDGVFDASQVWAFSLADLTWSPLGRACDGLLFYATSAFDETRGLVVLAGGVTSECSKVRVFDLATNEWKNVAGEGFESSAAAVDVARNRVLFFLGVAGNAVSQLSLASMTLSQLTPNTRGVLLSGSLVFDPVRNAAIAFAEEGPTYVHGLDPAATWSPLIMSAARRGSRAMYDPVAQEILGLGDGVSDTVHRLSSVGSDWETLDVPAGPSARRIPVAAYDSLRRRMIVRGGVLLDQKTVLDDTWALNLDGERAWTQLSPSGKGPGPREGEVGAYDPVGDRLIVFGGYADGEFQPDLHELAFGDGDGVWHTLSARGALPPFRNPNFGRPSMLYDAAGQRLIFLQLNYLDLPIVAALELGDTPTWHTFCLFGVPPTRYNGQTDAILLPDDSLFVAVGTGSYRFDLATPYCD